MATASNAPDSTLNRRSIVRGVAWAAPTIALATAAPSIAASPIRRITASGTITATPRGGSDNYEFTVTNPSISLTGFRANERVSAVCYSLWYPVQGIAFQAAPAGSNWSTPAASGATKVVSGATFYEYSSCHTGTLTIGTNGTLNVAVPEWKSVDWVKNARGTRYQVCATAYVTNVRYDNCSTVRTV